MDTREAKDVPENRKCVEDAIDIERRVKDQCGFKDDIPRIASRICRSRFAWERKKSLRRVRDMLVKVASIIALQCQGI